MRFERELSPLRAVAVAALVGAGAIGLVFAVLDLARARTWSSPPRDAIGAPDWVATQFGWSEIVAAYGLRLALLAGIAAFGAVAASLWPNASEGRGAA